MSLLEMDFEVVVVGTGLAESITAAALAKAGFNVAHIDTNGYYGGDHASLTLDEIVKWADDRAEGSGSSGSRYLCAQRARFRSIVRSQSSLPEAQKYAISLAPSIIPSSGPLISALIDSGASNYGQFKLLERIALYDKPGVVNNVPSMKEDIFKNKQMSLVEKRRLMRFFTFAAGEFEGKAELEGYEDAPLLDFLNTKFSVDGRIAETVVYALAFCISRSDRTLSALKRLRRYLRSSGRYGPSPFLVGHYGGSGELVQGFCRMSAVHGATYILGRPITSLHQQPDADGSSSTHRYTIKLQDIDEAISCGLIVSSIDYVQDSTPSRGMEDAPAVARCVAIVDTPLLFKSEGSQRTEQDDELQDSSDTGVDTAVLIFPPSCFPDGSTDTAVHLLVTGEGTLSAPKSRWIIYLSMPVSSCDVSAEEVLQPYLTATMSLTENSCGEPIFKLFYVQREDPRSTATESNNLLQIVTPPTVSLMPECSDAAVGDAEAMFRRAVGILSDIRGRTQSDGGAQPDEIRLWPPLQVNPTEDSLNEEEDW